MKFVSRIAEADGLSAGQLAAEGQYATDLADYFGKEKALAGMREALCSDARTIGAVELRGRRDEIEDAELDLAQDAVDLNSQCGDLLKARLPEVRAFAAKCEADRDKAYKAAAELLNRAGVSVETVCIHPAGQPIAAFNGDQAEIVFGHRVRESAEWRAANVVAVNAAEQVNACMSAIGDAATRLAGSEKFLTALVARIAGASTVRQPLAVA
jgi:hypothetical protein